VVRADVLSLVTRALETLDDRPVLARGALVVAHEQLVRDAGALDGNALHRAIMLSPDIETCRALLRGESVPVERLDRDQLRRYGLRGG
jgi:hypothetical protein